MPPIGHLLRRHLGPHVLPATAMLPLLEFDGSPGVDNPPLTNELADLRPFSIAERVRPDNLDRACVHQQIGDAAALSQSKSIG